MAGIESIKEDFLTCSICTEEYREPCTLSCQHSFCRKCVTQFLKTGPDSVQSKTIPCAFCRQVTPVPQPTRPFEEWSKQLKPSVMLQGLMDKLRSGHKHITGKDICFMCEKVGETTQASSWCSDCEMTLCRRCVKMHLEGPTTKKHDLFDLSGGAAVKQRRKIKCKEHEGEQIKYICKDCNKAVCQTCCILKHAKHNNVTIESMVPEIKSALIQKRRLLRQKMEKEIATVMREESRIEQLNMNVKRTEKEIKSSIENAITLLRKGEKDLVKELHDVSGKQMVEHPEFVKSGQITTQMYQQYCEFIDQALQSESEVDMYDMYQVCLSGAVESVRDTESDTRNTSVVEKVTFTSNMEPLRRAIAEMGKIDETFLTGKPNLATMQPVLRDTIDMKQVDDAKSADPIDVAILTVGGLQTLVVADYGNKCLKSVFVKKDKKQISRLTLSADPYRLAKITRNRVAATVSTKEIAIAEVKPELVLISTLKTSIQYFGLTSLPDSTLAAGSYSPPAVDILDLKGNILRSFNSYNTGLKLIQQPQYLCTTKEGNILVSDLTCSCLYCLTPEGNVVFTYTPTGDRALKYPEGIAVTNTGDILLAERKSKKVIQLTSEGIYIRGVLTNADGIDEPWGLCVDDTKLYLCNRRSDKSVKVFSLA